MTSPRATRPLSQSLKPVIAIAIAVAVGYGVVSWLIPTPEEQITEQLKSLAKTLSFSTESGNISRGIKAESMPGYFTKDCQVRVDVRGVGRRVFYGRMDIAGTARNVFAFQGTLAVAFHDLIVEVSTADPTKATVALTATIQAEPPGSFTAQEFRFELRDVEGDWLIERAETVETLSQ